MSKWRDIESAPRDRPILLLIGETIPDFPDVRVGSYIDGDYAEGLGEREYAKYGGWLIWNSCADWFVIDVCDPRGWAPIPEIATLPITGASDD